MSAVDAETVAWIAAGGTAAGALIGSAAGGGVAFVLERLRERRKALAGARLVRLDLAFTASQIRDAEHDAKWWQFNDDAVLGSWDTYAEVISPRLSPEQFEAVTQSVSELSRWVRHIRGVPKPPDMPYWPLSDKAIAGLRDMREHATQAHNALADLAKDKPDPKGQLLHEKQKPTT